MLENIDLIIVNKVALASRKLSCDTSISFLTVITCSLMYFRTFAHPKLVMAYLIISLKARRVGSLDPLLVSLIYLMLNLANSISDTCTLISLHSSTALWRKLNSLIPDSNSIVSYKKYSSNLFPNFEIFISTIILFSFGMVCLMNVLWTIKSVTISILFRNTWTRELIIS